MALPESAPDVELALDVGIGPRSGTNPRSESHISMQVFFGFQSLAQEILCVQETVMQTPRICTETRTSALTFGAEEQKYSRTSMA